MSGPRVALGGLTAVLVARMPAMLDEVAEALAPQWPEYAAFLGDRRDEVARGGEMAMARIVAGAQRALDGEQPDQGGADVAMLLFRQIGAAQAQAGHPLAPLLSAYQAGARAAWRHMARAAVEHGLPADAVAVLAESVFALIDQLCAATADGYTDEQSQSAIAHERARAELTDLLLSDRSDSSAVAAAAARARWPLPESVAVVLQDGPLGATEPGWLPIRLTEAHGVLVPDPASARAEDPLRTRFHGRGAVIAHPVGLDALPGAVRLARRTMRLHRDGVLDTADATGDPIYVGDHVDALIVHQDPRLLRYLRAEVLAPLAPLAPETRIRLTATLTSWLAELGDHRRVAMALHVHPQTVRYRLGQLRALFGDVLDDPAERRKLSLALGWCPPDWDPDGSGDPDRAG